MEPRLWVITAAFCPAAQLARSLLEFERHNDPTVIKRIIVVNCHYPRNYEKNQLDMKVFMDSYCSRYEYARYLDPGSDLGSAQSQNWVLDEISEEIKDDDYFINLDPDAACRDNTWLKKATLVLDNDPRCVVVTCNSPMVQHFVRTRYQEMEETQVSGVSVLIPDIPTPFNLSLWRTSFFRSIGGIPQMFPHYGEVEGPVFAMARERGYYNCYLKDVMENEDGKLMHDRCFEDWKDAHARTSGTHSFLGNFREYCELNGLLGEGPCPKSE